MTRPTVAIHRKRPPFGVLGHEFGALVTAETFVGFASASSPAEALQLVSENWLEHELDKAELPTGEAD